MSERKFGVIASPFVVATGQDAEWLRRDFFPPFLLSTGELQTLRGSDICFLIRFSPPRFQDHRERPLLLILLEDLVCLAHSKGIRRQSLVSFPAGCSLTGGMIPLPPLFPINIVLPVGWGDGEGFFILIKCAPFFLGPALLPLRVLYVIDLLRI